MTRRDLLAKLGVDEYVRQVAFNRVEPLEDAWIISAKLISTIYGLFGDRVPFGEIYHFLSDDPVEPDEEESKPKVTLPIEVVRLLSWATRHNALVARQEKLKGG